MKVGIYDRRGKLELEKPHTIRIAALLEWASTKKYEIYHVYGDHTNKFEEQLELKQLVQDATRGKFGLVIACSPFTLANCSWFNFMQTLKFLTPHVGVRFMQWSAVEINQVIAMINEWEDCKRSEHAEIMEHRKIYEQGGRPKKEFDVEEALRLRTEELLTYQEIGERMNVSGGLVHKSLIKSLSPEIRGRIPKDVRMRLRKQDRERRENKNAH